MREWCRHAGAAGACAAAAVLLAGCGSAPSPAARRAAPPPKPVPYNLYTRCGIDYAQVGNRYYEATAPLSDGSGNPGQPGTLTVISPTQAILTTKPGHHVIFTLTPSAPTRTPTRVCP